MRDEEDDRRGARKKIAEEILTLAIFITSVVIDDLLKIVLLATTTTLVFNMRTIISPVPSPAAINLDMLNKFCLHLYAQNSLFIGENCNVFF